jgi:GNAT superfamily N-acetyltransferase
MQTDLPITTANNHLRRLDARRDLEAVADLVELCFSETLDPEGRNYLNQMRQAAQHARLVGWANSLYNESVMPPSGLVWEEVNGDNNDQHIVGNLSLIPIQVQGKRCYLIANVAVHPDFRDRGIGRQLTDRALEIARSRGAPAAWLHVRDDNPAAIHIYQTAGFIERARRSSWVNTGVIPSTSAASSLIISKRQTVHWEQQLAWLRNLYPSELSWHLSLDWKIMPPGLRGMLYRFFSLESPRHWAALRSGRLVCLLTWIRSSGFCDQLWLAAPTELDQPGLVSILQYARLHTPHHRPLSLNLPAGLGEQALQQAGFTTQQTLIWMENPFNQ